MIFVLFFDLFIIFDVWGNDHVLQGLLKLCVLDFLAMIVMVSEH